MLRSFVDAGGDALDIAPWHGGGLGPSIVGSLVPPEGRDRLTYILRSGVTPKSLAGEAWGLGPHGKGTAVPSGSAGGVGRGALLGQLDRALRDLSTDHVDLWIPQGPRGSAPPLDEVLSAMQTALDSGRARYVGLSHFGVWDTAAADAALPPGHRLTAVEEEHSLLNRAAEASFGGALMENGIGLIAHSPLARGVLTGKYRNSTPPDSRAASAHLRDWVRPYLSPQYTGIVDALIAAADGLERTPAQVALAWTLMQPGVSAAVIGPRNMRQLLPLLDMDPYLPREIAAVLSEVSG